MVARMTVKPSSVLEGSTIAQVKHKLDVSVILHKRAEYLNPHPAPETTIRADDCLVVFASRETLARLGEMSRESPGPVRKRAWNVPLRPWLERLLSREKRPKQ
jgi:Trk K+ transport system NAD-binding subunit